VGLTRRGWALATITAALLVGGRLFGLVELYVAGTATGLLLGSTALFVGLTRLQVEVRRTVHPPRVYAGTPSRVDLVVRNRSRRKTPVLRLEDTVTGTRGAQLLLGPLAPGADAQAAYRLPTARRGIVQIGPLTVALGDAFGLSEIRLEGAGVSELTVLPTIDRISAPPHTTGDDPHSGAEHPNSLGRSGEDFYALRRYVVGDDLRRVHWRATARHDELMVRQDEIPWQGRATILLDVRRSTTSPEALDLAVSAAASIVMASWRRQDLIRLVATDGTDSGFAAGHGPVDALMEYLATVEVSAESSFRSSVDRLAHGSAGGALVAVVSDMSEAELDAIARLRTRYGWVKIVSFEPSSWDPSAPESDRVSTPLLLRVRRSRPFAAVWESAVGRRRPGLVDAASALVDRFEEAG
jgi:uncharacterized protein (DUF58 family)